MESVLLDNLKLIERIVTVTARRRRLNTDQTEELRSLVNLKLVAEDYKVLRAFAGRGSLATYLTSVVQRVLLDLRNHEWGRWRPSAEARRLGPLAIRVELLMHRDRLTLEEACACSAEEDRAEMRRLAVLLQHRVGRWPEGEGTLADIASNEVTPEDAFLDSERESLRRALYEATEHALEALAPEDRLLLRMRMEEGTSVADIARVLGRDQRRLYHRFETLLRTLRSFLERSGFDARQVAWALDGGQHPRISFPAQASSPSSRRRTTPDERLLTLRSLSPEMTQSELAEWGRWRPSAEARRLGPLAIRVELLMQRDRLTLEEACACSAEEDRAEMRRLAMLLPHRACRRFEGEEALASLPSLCPEMTQSELADCLELEVLAALAAGHLTGPEHNHAVTHVAECATCRELLAETLHVRNLLGSEDSAGGATFAGTGRNAER